MGLETGTYINSLVPSNPTGGDPKAQGDDHIRLIKSTLKNTFPNVNGAVTVTDEDLNAIPGILTGKADITYVDSENDDQNSLFTAALALKAPLASPALTGVPTVPTAPAGTSTNQVASTAFAMGAVAESFDESITANGWTELPNGLILQWGNTSDTSGDKSFPRAFPTACLTLVGNQHPLANDGNGVTFTILSTSKFRVQVGAVGGDTVYWMAIGH